MTKKLMMMVVAAVAAAFGAWAETEKVGGYTWTYRNFAPLNDSMCQGKHLATID